MLHTSVWIWPKTSRSVTGRKSSTLLELNIGFLRTGSSNGQWPTATYNKTISRSIPAHTIMPTISMTTMVIITHYILYCIVRGVRRSCVRFSCNTYTVHTQLLSDQVSESGRRVRYIGFEKPRSRGHAPVLIPSIVYTYNIKYYYCCATTMHCVPPPPYYPILSSK